MSLFGMFGGERPKVGQGNGNGHEEKKAAEFIHVDLQKVDGIWRANAAYELGHDYEHDPSFSFTFTDAEAADLLEDFPGPVRVRRISPHEYLGNAFVTPDTMGTVSEWLAQHHTTVIAEPLFQNEAA